jgi:DNA-binding Lrp family transcriptional regulator
MSKDNNIREIKNCRWYWIDKAVIHEYAPEIGAMGIAVYCFLASLADSKQKCFPSQKYIAEKFGCSRSTVNKTVKVLEQHRLIKRVKRDRYHCTYLLLKVRCKAEETQVSSVGNSDVSGIDTNDNKRIKNIINIDKGKIWTPKYNAFKKFRPRTREEALALDLAEELDDYKGLPLYISFAKKYPESLLRKILGQVKEIPREKIKKSRGALFNHLVWKNGGKPLYS